MARLSLTKASLTRQKSLLKAYSGVLPSLDLKRRQISGEREAARKILLQAQQRVAAIEPQIAEKVPMLSDEAINLTDMVRITHVELVEENLMGTRLPALKKVDMQVKAYGLLTRPFWVDQFVDLLKSALEASIQVQVAQRRLDLLQLAERTVTQRFNLFDKVLIPQAKGNIKRISIYLADAERAGVVNSKIAKRKKEAQQA